MDEFSNVRNILDVMNSLLFLIVEYHTGGADTVFMKFVSAVQRAKFFSFEIEIARKKRAKFPGQSTRTERNCLSDRYYMNVIVHCLARRVRGLFAFLRHGSVCHPWWPHITSFEQASYIFVGILSSSGCYSA